jgi:hypothetical protein
MQPLAEEADPETRHPIMTTGEQMGMCSQDLHPHTDSILSWGYIYIIHAVKLQCQS